MISEKQFEDIICKHPEIIEDDLTLIDRQATVYGKRMDVLFEDKFKQKLIIELKVGPIDRKHIGQIMEYEGSILSVEDPTARIMLIGNRVPPNLKKALDHHGIEWKEISLSQLKEFLTNKNDSEFLNLFNEVEIEPIIKQPQGTNFRMTREQGVKLKKYPQLSGLTENGIIKDSEQIDYQSHEYRLSFITNIQIKEKINYLREKIEAMGHDIEKGGRGERAGWMIYRVYGHQSGRGRIFVRIGEISHKSFAVAVHPMSKTKKVANYEAKPWRREECNPSTVAGHYRLPPDIFYEDLEQIIQCIRDAYMYNRSRV